MRLRTLLIAIFFAMSLLAYAANPDRALGLGVVECVMWSVGCWCWGFAYADRHGYRNPR